MRSEAGVKRWCRGWQRRCVAPTAAGAATDLQSAACQLAACASNSPAMRLHLCLSALVAAWRSKPSERSAGRPEAQLRAGALSRRRRTAACRQAVKIQGDHARQPIKRLDARGIGVVSSRQGFSLPLNCRAYSCHRASFRSHTAHCVLVKRSDRIPCCPSAPPHTRPARTERQTARCGCTRRSTIGRTAAAFALGGMVEAEPLPPLPAAAPPAARAAQYAAVLQRLELLLDGVQGIVL